MILLQAIMAILLVESGFSQVLVASRDGTTRRKAASSIANRELFGKGAVSTDDNDFGFHQPTGAPAGIPATGSIVIQKNSLFSYDSSPSINIQGTGFETVNLADIILHISNVKSQDYKMTRDDNARGLTLSLLHDRRYVHTKPLPLRLEFYLFIN